MKRYIFISFFIFITFSCSDKYEDYQLPCSLEVPNGLCSDGKSCIDGSCQLACSEECKDWQVCKNGNCETALGRCTNNDDCLSSAKCEDHLCIKDIDLCGDINCSNHGECKVENNQTYCVCDTGYIVKGLNCVQPCESIDCSNHGFCHVENNKAICDCEPGFTAKNLTCILTCNLDCSNHGECKVENNQAICECSDGFIFDGVTCIEQNPCSGIECSDNESCILSDGIAKCECNEGYHRNDERLCVAEDLIDWSISCPAYINNRLSNAQCALIDVPLDYNNPNGEKIKIFAYRSLSTSNNKKGQILFLQGGPGGSGLVFASYFNEFRERYSDFDLYSTDHRGVGNSVDLYCEAGLNNLENFQHCVSQLNMEWGDKVKQFSTSNAAKDLGFLFSKIRQNNVKQFLYGVSYGTYWAEKYLYFFPQQIDGVILDSIASINATWMDDYNIGLKTVGESFMQVVASDTTASEKLSQYGDTPMIALENLFTKISNGEGCEVYNDYQLTLNEWKSLFGNALMNYYSRIMIPSLIYRAHRCDDLRDKPVLKTFIEKLFENLDKSFHGIYVSEEDIDSNELYYNISFSELWKGNSLEQILAIEESSYFIASSLADMYSFYHEGGWNTYSDDGTFRSWPNTNIPILMLNGTLDPQTPLALANPSREHFDKANQTFIEFPQTPHGVIFAALTTDGESCGDEIMRYFFNNPTGVINQSCINNLQLLGFSNEYSNNRSISNYFYETSDMWDGMQTRSHRKSNLEDAIKKSFLIK